VVAVFVLGTAQDWIETAGDTELGAYAGWLDERIVGNLHGAYLDGSVPKVDLRSTLKDMVGYNGGKPLSCYA